LNLRQTQEMRLVINVKPHFMKSMIVLGGKDYNVIYLCEI